MKAKDFRQLAYGKIKKKCWGILAGAEVIISIFLGIAGALNRFYIGWIISLLIGGAFAFSQAYMALNAADSKSITFNDTFVGFKHFGSSLVLNLLITIFTALWSLLLIVPGIIMSHAYAMSYFILLDNPSLAPNEARKQSIQLMKGYKWKLFCLRFSFIGWYLLGILTLGILYFWILPYQRTAEAEFYRNLVAAKSEQDAITVEAEPVAETKTVDAEPVETKAVEENTDTTTEA